MASGSLANMSATIGVSIVPGHTALMQIPLEAYSSAALFGRFHDKRYYAGVIERGIEATKGGYRLRDHCCYFSFVSDIAANADRLVFGVE